MRLIGELQSSKNMVRKGMEHAGEGWGYVGRGLTWELVVGICVKGLWGWEVHI